MNPVNSNRLERWTTDITQSVDFYNDWFMSFAPKAYRDSRSAATEHVMRALHQTSNMTNLSPDVLRSDPSVLVVLRMTTAPPLARDRLIGLAGVSPNLVRSMEMLRQVPRINSEARTTTELKRIGEVVLRLIDEDIFPWLNSGDMPSDHDVYRAATVVADRYCGAVADPIIRNAQEKRQLDVVRDWLESRGYRLLEDSQRTDFRKIPQGTFGFRVNVPIQQGLRQVNVPIDAVVMPHHPQPGELPLLIEAKSAGDFTNPNKRRKEEATKISQLRATYGQGLRFILFLCGYFDSGYLRYEAAEGIDWVWEHRIGDLVEFGL